jgi:peptidoglycan hydrolase-like protein with peptidoglycan-binding domain
MAKKLYINPGHSNNDPGAIGHEVERELNVKVSNYMNEYILANYEVETRMNAGSVDSLSVIVEDANNWGADLFVSNHFNAGGGDGYEALIYSENRIELGKIFANHVAAIGQNLRPYGVAPGVKCRPGLYVLKHTNMPAVLNESAFVDTLKDIQDWNDENELKKLGIAYAEAAAEYLKLNKKVVAPAKPVNASYTLTQFVKDVQTICGAKVDGIAGPETLSKTITLSASVNRAHKLVKPVQKRLSALGYAVGTIDGIAGAKFTAAVKAFQKDTGCYADGEITARNKTWKKLLGM